ncbi:adenine phosphoribosyltransferase [Lentisphaera profundi]|uniref:Adenine phosphoribosyltransferase n=1 Tax=Lentisphaera profundi TaxID=1658616 RepID=A0ABY7VT18_9BACT|nr:adenine phosphoribosyltransferase [Lentisphaera profundi]WDE96862.1 adenine phosphoribosyltransferase [Lentisphaera profundi]
MSDDFSSCLRDIPDFPSPGIIFKDISPLLANPQKFTEVIDAMAKIIEDQSIDFLLGIDSRGFIFASALAQKLKIGMVMARKPGKLPGEVVSQSYDLEYGSATLEIQKDAFEAGDRILVIDDVLATGGTARAASDLVEKMGAHTAGYLFFVELEFLNGRQVLNADSVNSLVKF